MTSPIGEHLDMNCVVKIRNYSKQIIRIKKYHEAPKLNMVQNPFVSILILVQVSMLSLAGEGGGRKIVTTAPFNFFQCTVGKCSPVKILLLEKIERK